MERFNALSRGAQIMLVASVLLLIDSFLDWQQVSFGGVSAGVSGWDGVGFIMGLLTIALIAWLVMRLLDMRMNLPMSAAMITVALAALILLFTVIKVLVDNEARHWPAWLGLILAVVIAVGAWMEMQEAGGMDTLKTEASSMSSRGSSGSTGSTGAAAPPPPSAPPAAPSQPAQPMEPGPPSGGTSAPDRPGEDRPPY